MAAPLPREGDPLSLRELDVLQCVAAGWTNLDIAAYLGISPHTVKHHISRILAKLGARNRTAAAMTTLQENIVRHVEGG